MDLRNGEKLLSIAPVVSQAEEEAQPAEAPAENRSIGLPPSGHAGSLEKEKEDCCSVSLFEFFQLLQFNSRYSGVLLLSWYWLAVAAQ